MLGLYAYDGGHVIRTDAPFEFGASGGGLFDASGNLVGILAFKATNAQAAGFALPSEWLDPSGKVFASVDTTASAAATAFWERAEPTRPAFLGLALREARAKQP